MQPFVDNLAYDRDLGMHVAFSTKSDAMLASLLLFHHVPVCAMELVFSVVKHPSFNPSDISLSSSMDVFARAEHEKSLKHIVASTADRNSSSGIPSIILDGVAEALEHERTDVLRCHRDSHLLFPSALPNLLNPAENAIKSMSLVHSTWRQPAQRALGRVLFMTKFDLDVVLNALRGPLYGPWTREVIIDNRYVHFVKAHSLRRIERLVLRTTRLTSLCIVTYKPEIQDWIIHTLLQNLKHYQHSLETLVLVSSDRAFMPYEPFMDVLGRLYRLRSLGIGNIYSSEDERDQPTSFIPTPPSSLRSIALSPSLLPNPAFSGLFLPSDSFEGGFSLKALSLIDTGALTDANLRFFAPMFARLHKLRIRDDERGTTKRNHVALILSLCTALRDLTVSTACLTESQYAHCPHPPSLRNLPQSLNHLHLDFSPVHEVYKNHWSKIDVALFSLVESQLCPVLTAITISPSPSSQHGPPFIMENVVIAVKHCKVPKTMSICKEKNISLQIGPESPFLLPRYM